MAAVIPPDFVDQVLARTDIVEIIDGRVPLKKTGQDYSALCPFHSEKTPSFTVSQSKQFYYCFGCQASGHALGFLMAHDRMDFPAAVQYLATRAGMQVPRAQGPSKQDTRRRKGLYEILQQADAFYRQQLRRHEQRDRAVSYLKQRGLTGKTAAEYGIGFAPPGWDSLLRALATSNQDRQLLIEAGLVVDREEDSKVYDRFRNRIIFPIRDSRGRPIAFGGRALLADDKPKYLNSPETPVFHKGRELYGLFEARRRRAPLSQLLVVEGYMDVIALAQHGIGYAVATLGTATSAEHLDRLFRTVQQVVFCFDGDAAGRQAARKALDVALAAMQDGRSARFLFLPEGQDPDSLVHKENAAAFEARIGKATSLADFFFDDLTAKLDMQTMEGKAALAEQAAPRVQRVPAGVFKQLLVEELAARTGLTKEELIKETGLDPAASPPAQPRQARRPEAAASAKERLGASLVDQAITQLLHYPEVVTLLDDGERTGLAPGTRWQLLNELLDYFRSRPGAVPALALNHYRETAHFQYLDGLVGRERLLDAASAGQEFKGAIARLLAQAQRDIQQELVKDILKKSPASLTENERNLLKKHTKSESSRA